jgi:hypothetical protein
MQIRSLHPKNTCSLCEARAARAANSPLEGVQQPIVEEEEPIVPEDLADIEPNIDIPEVFANMVIKEHAHITIHSDRKCDPTSPDYDLKIPPATYIKAVQHADRDQWMVAMKAELQIMDEMHVYELTALPAGRKAIGNWWVLEFKEDNKGGSAYKARLVAQGFSQIPGGFRCNLCPGAQNRLSTSHLHSHLHEQLGAGYFRRTLSFPVGNPEGRDLYVSAEGF